ncbi:MAG: hypothetical protein COA96_03610 [SAR86 cluster bacterium]|uniref:Uncharacterized protein n=1 Tax=SAR86 cluster bacterium TaxID=2030880 RepID=A0A2A5B6W3_9GAMM|nr:MAG: hypothetical protein COA96_03610 [SAR86 cluster bacterium]
MFEILALLFSLLFIAAAYLLIHEIYGKNIHIWLHSYATRQIELPNKDEPVHIIFTFCDHFEPGWNQATYEEEVARVDRWCEQYADMASKHKDADGCFPKHSFFFPEEEYREEHLSKLSQLCAKGFGEIEIHLHHDNDTAEGLTEKLQGFLETLDNKHHAVAKDPVTNQYRFAFIHGNWALDNSRKDGRWCGVDNELAVLAKAGCYADFTLPSAPSDTQTAKINSIYYATGQEGKSKSHNDGIDVEAGVPGKGDLIIIQGPLCLNWRNRKFGLLPRIENSDIRENSPPSKQRVDLWVDCAIQVKSQPQWRFIKIHTHGTQESDMDTLLGEPTDSMFSYLEEKYNDDKNFVLHYASAREMYNIVLAAEANKKGNPNKYRDFKIPRPPLLDT